MPMQSTPEIDANWPLAWVTDGRLMARNNTPVVASATASKTARA